MTALQRTQTPNGVVAAIVRNPAVLGAGLLDLLGREVHAAVCWARRSKVLQLIHSLDQHNCQLKCYKAHNTC